MYAQGRRPVAVSSSGRLDFRADTHISHCADKEQRCAGQTGQGPSLGG